MQLKAVALEKAFEEDISFISHLVRESGINLDEQDIDVSIVFSVNCAFICELFVDNKIIVVLNS